MSDKQDNLDLVTELSKNRIILLNDEFDFDLAKNVISLLLMLDLKDKNEPISLYINSIGGDVDCLFAIYDCIQTISAPVKTICLGCAYSAGALILASGSPGMRYAAENSHIMIHQIQVGGISGSGTDLEIEAKATKNIKEKLNYILARHTGQYLTKIKRDCERDKYMTAQQAKEYGIVDHILESTKQIPSLKKKASGRKKKEGV